MVLNQDECAASRDPLSDIWTCSDTKPIPSSLLVSLVGGFRERSDLTKEDPLFRFLQLEERIDGLEEKLDQKDERIEELDARLRKYENPHSPPSKRRSATDSD